jgi:tetratricopeptide (TPR) repeat protein
MDPRQNFLTRARLLIQQGRFALAEEQLRLLLGVESENATAHALLAICLVEQEKIQEAEAEANLAIHHAPDQAQGFFAKSVVLHRQKKLAEAKVAIQEAICIEPWESIYFARLAALEHDAYQWTASLAAAEQGLQCDPDDVECTNLRAIALVKLGRKEEAGRTIDAALAKAPDNAVTHANQGWTLLHQGDAKKAMEHFREALRLDPNSEWARLGIIESMKARFFLYRWLLKFFLWMMRFSPRTQILLLLGLVFGQRLLAEVFQAVPALVPLQLPIIIAYVLFAWMTWVAPSLFNLVLFLSPFGRLVLKRDEKLGAVLVGTCILIGLLVAAVGHLMWPQWASYFWTLGLLGLGLAIPASSILRYRGSPRLVMGAYTLGLACVLATAGWRLYSLIEYADPLITAQEAGEPLPPSDLAEIRVRQREFTRWVIYSINGIALSTWLGLALVPMSRRRR